MLQRGQARKGTLGFSCIIWRSRWLRGEKVQLISQCFGESPPKKLSCGPKPQSETRWEWQTGEEDPACVASERDCVTPEKSRGQTLGIYSHRNEAEGRPSEINSFTTKWGRGDGGVFKGRGQISSFLAPTSLLGYQPVLICKQKLAT